MVSNREPYMHQLQGGKLSIIVPAGGLVTALDPVLQACGGLWVAHGAGDADRDTVDAHGRLTVPPNEPRYTLRRVWLSREEEQGYYYGFSNEGLWPLCHLAHERPIFRASDWKGYVQANQRFAEAVLEEIGPGKAVVLVQDYQLSLVPQLLKAARPELCVGIFWHIPWPNPEAFRICPWRVELLQGMLGADLVGFHLQQYCNNFLDTVDRMLETRLDWDHFAVDLAKEYVAAQAASDGMLILSEFAGAARELTDALIVNPYDTEQFADTIHAALVMDSAERQARMARMRKSIEENNIYRWAANLLAELSATRKPDTGVGAPVAAEHKRSVSSSGGRSRTESPLTAAD